MCATIRAWSAAFLVVSWCGSASGQGGLVNRASVDNQGAQGDGDSSSASFSADGRFVAFDSEASNLVPGDTNVVRDVFVHDRQTGETTRASVDSQGVQGNASSFSPSISADGRMVAFTSYATNLVPGGVNMQPDVFVHDRLTGITIRADVTPLGNHASNYAKFASISANGRFVVFMSPAYDLVVGDINNHADVFVYDLQTGRTSLVSVRSNGMQGNANSGFFDRSAISGDGRYVAFQSFADNLVPGDTNGHADVFVHDRQNGQTIRVSVDSQGVQADLGSGRCGTSISVDGRYIVFLSYATNLVSGDSNGFGDIFVHDLQTAQTHRVNVSTFGLQANAETGFVSTSISDDGRWVTFDSFATNLVHGDSGVGGDVFIRDRQTGQTRRISVDAQGVEADGSSAQSSMSGDGRFIAFSSSATNLVNGDTNGRADVFVRDRDPTSFTSLCDPGVSGVIACPCSNPPAGAERGCDNSSATGGASLSALGIAYLSDDTLEMTTSGERPEATSIFVQATASISSGLVYGQGVRCAGGVLLRLFVKTAFGGSITVPDIAANDPSISARSAALGDPILGGGSRYYFVYYRDPAVLGGCPTSSTFNATQTGQIVWWW